MHFSSLSLSFIKFNPPYLSLHTSLSLLVQELNAKLEPVILWENPDPTQAFPAQVITLDGNFERYELYYSYSGDGALLYSANSLRGHGCSLFLINSANIACRRTIYWEEPNQLSVGNAQYTNSSASSNTSLIPIRIIGYIS